MDINEYYPRILQQKILDSLADSPSILIHGPRQCGKTTLARLVGDEKGYAYISFDDDVQRAAAKTDPVGYVADLPEYVVLDEVQRAPEIFTSLKLAIDSDRRPGRFILTGSSNVLLLPTLADSLAGRMELLRLHPLCQAELRRTKPNFIERSLAADFASGPSGHRLGKDLAEVVAAGGYPEALKRSTQGRRRIWYRNYAETIIQRDVRDIARIQALHVMPRLLSLAAAQTSCLTNISEIAAPFQISRTTIRDYLTLLSRIFLVDELQCWHSNLSTRVLKTPKLHIGDTGLACALLGKTADSLWADRSFFGRILESFVFQELRRLAVSLENQVDFYHYRDKDQTEVDVVMESDGRIVGVEVKAASTITTGDFKGLRKLREIAGTHFASGVLLYDGDAIVGFGDRMIAVPISQLWEGNYEKPD